ncbi:HlyD family type I secretion periplasmic adaptor subunit [Chitinimonas sp. BJB300]|uniref:HlyD family type I secretion periplasmic adaptor subunit n=1 Tax=Chitinimonas sp. BJB300 TaxID=1559339 RepID=UPI000C0E9316|nr:HlyD family type I secretion periplasmic adaptor subunit [Chitinimonas sp. BJB300]PHV13291.1 hemolysin secretion protein D [Chitinimonas sp. BJB300]TSJ86004.1 HlyD family type I secretion periplasmic adaptor subunit [Chitinimonas sp. BJB300]
MSLALHAVRDLFTRYTSIWKTAWAQRHDMVSPQRTDHELAFLPAHLELQEAPVHPAPRWAMRLIIALLAITLLWALIGKLDIVAVAPGKVVPNDRIKVVQPLEAGVVRAIHIRDGQAVTAGQLLIELDATATGADVVKSEEAHEGAALALARANALLQALEQRSDVQLISPPGVSSQRVLAETQLAQAQLAEHRSKQATLSAELQKRRAELTTTRALVNKLEQTLPISNEQAADYKRLLEQNFVSRHGYLAQEKERIGLEKDLVAQRSRIQELTAAIQEQETQMTSLTAEFRRQLLDAQNQAYLQSMQFTEDSTKAHQRQQLTRLTAPVSGTVQQLVVHTVGGVVTAAQPLLVIVPDDSLEIEAMVENKDIGFVSQGQYVTVKVETFPYTRYGYLRGRVISVSNDAINDEKRGLVYHARVKLDADKMWIDRKWIRLAPGMAVTAEVKTGLRRIIDYFLSPLTEQVSEGFRER